MTTRPALTIPGYLDGIDVSKYQGSVDAQKVADAGFRFAFAKVSEGLAYCDPRAAENLARLRDAGLYTGTYGFARVEQGSPRAQARHALDGCAAVGAGTEHVVRPVLDLESAPPSWGAGVLCDFAQEWLDEARLGGALPVLYSYTSFLARMGADVHKARLWALLFDTPLWLAQYRSTTQAWAPSSEADMPRGYDWQLWQYSGDGGHEVDGIRGPTDRNLFRGDEAALRAWFGLPSAAPSDGGILHGSHVIDSVLGGHGPYGDE